MIIFRVIFLIECELCLKCFFKLFLNFVQLIFKTLDGHFFAMFLKVLFCTF